MDEVTCILSQIGQGDLAVAEQAQEKTIVAADSAGTVRFMDSETLSTRVSVMQEDTPVTRVASPDETLLLVATREGNLRTHYRGEAE